MRTKNTKSEEPPIPITWTDTHLSFACPDCGHVFTVPRCTTCKHRTVNCADYDAATVCHTCDMFHSKWEPDGEDT